MAYNVTGQIIYTPSISTVVNNGSAISLTVDLSNYELRDNYGNGGKVYFPNPSSQYTQFGEDFTIYCYSSSDCSGSNIATLTATLNRINSQKASITFTLPTGTRSFRISEAFTTLVSSEYYDYTNFGGYVNWGAPNRYDTELYYWKSKEPYTACGAPTSCSLSSTLSTGNVALSWRGASAGTSNSITGYKIQRCESSDGSNWGSWADLTTVNSTSTSASLTVSPPSTAGNYYKYRVLTMGSAGSSYYSGWLESSNSLRRDHTPLESFTDDPLMVGVSPVKALHMQELQSRVSTLRTFYGLGTYNFTTITAGATSLAGWTTHVNQIRTAIEEVCSASGKTHEDWISFSVNCPRADIIQQLRNVILAL